MAAGAAAAAAVLPRCGRVELAAAAARCAPPEPHRGACLRDRSGFSAGLRSTNWRRTSMPMMPRRARARATPKPGEVQAAVLRRLLRRGAWSPWTWVWRRRHWGAAHWRRERQSAPQPPGHLSCRRTPPGRRAAACCWSIRAAGAKHLLVESTTTLLILCNLVDLQNTSFKERSDRARRQRAERDCRHHARPATDKRLVSRCLRYVALAWGASSTRPSFFCLFYLLLQRSLALTLTHSALSAAR